MIWRNVKKWLTLERILQPVSTYRNPVSKKSLYHNFNIITNVNSYLLHYCLAQRLEHIPKQRVGSSHVQELSKVSPTSCLSSPLNLSVGSSSNVKHSSGGPNCNVDEKTDDLSIRNLHMPHLILASGQILKRVQEAQLLIPTSQGKDSACVISCILSLLINPFYL